MCIQTHTHTPHHSTRHPYLHFCSAALISGLTNWKATGIDRPTRPSRSDIHGIIRAISSIFRAPATRKSVNWINTSYHRKQLNCQPFKIHHVNMLDTSKRDDCLRTVWLNTSNTIFVSKKGLHDVKNEYIRCKMKSSHELK